MEDLREGRSSWRVGRESDDENVDEVGKQLVMALASRRRPLLVYASTEHRAPFSQDFPFYPVPPPSPPRKSRRGRSQVVENSANILECTF